MDNRGLYALYTPTTSRILVVVVHPFNNREISIAQLERQFRDAVRNQSQSNVDTSELACKVRMVKLKPECIANHRHCCFGISVNRILILTRNIVLCQIHVSHLVCYHLESNGSL